jgi:hypothetical protein
MSHCHTAAHYVVYTLGPSKARCCTAWIIGVQQDVAATVGLLGHSKVAAVASRPVAGADQLDLQAEASVIGGFLSRGS